MTILWQFVSALLAPLALGALVLAFGVLPGWLLTRSLHRDPLVRLLAATVAGFTVLYLAEFGAYVLSAPAWLPPAVAVALAAISLGRIVVRTRGGHDDERFPWRAALGWLGLLSWLLAIQSHVVAYGASSWYGDWYEHYERTLFFVDQLPPATKFLSDTWTLPARGPVFNAAAAVFLAPLGRSFWIYQVVATALNSIIVLPLAVLLRDEARVDESKATLLAAVLLAVAPFALSQETYPWTKFFTDGLYLAGVVFYLRSLRGDERRELVWSALSFGAGVLTHFLVVPMVAPFALHALYRAARGRARVSALVASGVVGGLLLATWLAYSFAVFGVVGTVTAHTAFSEGPEALYSLTMDGSRMSRAGVTARNVIATLVPSGLRHQFPVARSPGVLGAAAEATKAPLPPDAVLARAREQQLADLVDGCDSFGGDLGIAGLAALLTVAWRRRSARGADPPRDGTPPESLGAVFWLVSASVVLVVFAWASRVYCPNGIAGTGLQAYMLLLFVWLVARLRGAPSGVVRALAAAFLVESAISAGALIALESRTLPIVRSGDDSVVVGRIDAAQQYVANTALKLDHGAVFLSDSLGDMRWVFALFAASLAVVLLAAALARLAESARSR